MSGFKKTNRIAQKIFSSIYLLKILLSEIRHKKRVNELDTVVYWIKTSPFTIRYWKQSDVIQDVAVVIGLRRNYNVRIVVGKRIRLVKDSRVIYSVSKSFKFLGLDNYNLELIKALELVEERGNEVVPSIDVLKFWENKIFMHIKFHDLQINTPSTVIFNKSMNPHVLSKFGDGEVLLKLPHSSGSNGIIKFSNVSHLREYLLADKDLSSKSDFLVQKRLNMSFDIRIVVNNGEVVYHYWRINPDASVWHPTSTSRGSALSYKPLPEGLTDYIKDISQKLNLKYCAYDVAYENDDTTSQPLILEVSSHYQMNPVNNTDKAYRDYKKSLFISKPYWKEYIDITINELQKQYESYTRRF